LGSDKRKFPKWLMTRLTEPKTKIETIIPDEALIALSICQTKGLLIDRLPNLVQVENFCTRTINSVYVGSQKFFQKCLSQ